MNVSFTAKHRWKIRDGVLSVASVMVKHLSFEIYLNNIRFVYDEKGQISVKHSGNWTKNGKWIPNYYFEKRTKVIMNSQLMQKLEEELKSKIAMMERRHKRNIKLAGEQPKRRKEYLGANIELSKMITEAKWLKAISKFE